MEIKATKENAAEALGRLTRIQMTLPPGECVSDLTVIQDFLHAAYAVLPSDPGTAVDQVKKVEEAARRGFHGK